MGRRGEREGSREERERGGREGGKGRGREREVELKNCRRISLIRIKGNLGEPPPQKKKRKRVAKQKMFHFYGRNPEPEKA